MPNRIIRDSCKTSLSLAKLSAEAERLFWRLVTVADDYGRFEAEPVLLLAKCFPLKVQTYKLKDISKWYAELEACEHVQTYVSNCYHYGLFTSWEKHQACRAKTSKFPSPTDANICSQMRAYVSVVGVGNVIGNVVEDVNVNESEFAQFWSAYPKKVGKGAAQQSWDRKHPPIDLVLKTISEQKNSEQWNKDGGQYIPNPTTWLNQERWLDEVKHGIGKGNSVQDAGGRPDRYAADEARQRRQLARFEQAEASKAE